MVRRRDYSKRFDWVAELIRAEIKDPKCIDDYATYAYEHIDILELMPLAESVLEGVDNADAVLQAVQRKFRSVGWEGDGDIQVMWLPPFVGAGFEDTWGIAIWFVKQSNNGTAFMASPVKLPFSRLLEQQR